MQPYFSHDIFTREDLNIKRLISTHKMEGYGVFWGIVEFLHNNENKINLEELDLVAKDLNVSKKLVESVIKNFKLFTIRKNIVSSKRVAKNFKLQKEKSEKARKMANRRWERDSADAAALLQHCHSNAIKEKKEKEIKENKNKEEESKETNKEKKIFYGQLHNVFLTSFQYGSLAAQYGKSLTESIINELSLNIGEGKEHEFDDKYPNAHFVRLERYALQKISCYENDCEKTQKQKSNLSKQKNKTPAVEQQPERKECEALRHIREIKESGGVPPPKEFFEIGKRLKKEL